MSVSKKKSPLELLDDLVVDSPEFRRAVRRERLRLGLARAMKRARETAGLTQQDVAGALGVTQAWVSKLENANYDHKLESVLSYFDAVGANMSLEVEAGDSSFQVWGSGVPALSCEVAERGALGHSLKRGR